MLNEEQIQGFHRDGYVVIENAVSPREIEKLSNDYSRWLEESRDYTESYGTTLSGRPRFDLDPAHTSEAPTLRRVATPCELSRAYYKAMKESRIADCVAQLIGPNVRYHHCKINSKQPGTKTQVKFHQDFLYSPYSNDSLITALLFLDDVTEQSGPLEVVPGTHKGPFYSLWHNGVFTGAINEELAESLKGKTHSCTGKAGTACLMHTRLLHGSGINISSEARTLYIIVYTSEDSVPLAENPLPSVYDGEIIRGKKTNTVRCTEYQMECPEIPQGASFFSQQEKYT